MDYVDPKKIMSPFSGEWCTPKIKQFEYSDKVVTEAWWYCPSSGEFMQKGIVSEHPKVKDEQK